MAPATAFEKDTSDREYIRDELDFLDTQLTAHSKAALTRIQVKQALDSTADAQKSLNANHSSMRHHAPKGTDLQSYIQDYFELREKASRLYSGFHGIYSQFPTSPTSSTSAATSSSTSLQTVRLPRLEIPKFSGNLQEWVSFRDMFKNTVDSSSITKVEKLTQLKSLLTGEAARQIRSLVLSDANYDIAWAALEERYENNRELMFSIMRRMFSQPTVTTGSATHLRGLIDTTKECVRQLEVLSLPTQHWDAMLIYILFSKADPTTRELWEQSLPNTNIPALSKLYEFLEQRARGLAAGTAPPPPPPRPFGKQDVKFRSNHMAPSPCKVGCTDSHPIFRCLKFRNQTSQQRSETVKRLNLCTNCLGSGHRANSCTSLHTCKQCNQKHHTLLHQQPQESPHTAAATTSIQQPPTAPSYFVQPAGLLRTGILATANVRILAPFGNSNRRALLDSGTTNTSITEDVVRALNLPTRRCNIQLTGLEETTVGVAKHITTFEFTPHFNSSVKYAVTALVVQSIGDNMPHERLPREKWSHLHGLQLADPSFEKPAKVNILFGADVFWQILENEKIGGRHGQPLAIKTSLGWVVAGENSSSTPIKIFHIHASLDQSLTRFWEQESTEDVESPQTKEEDECEAHFATTHQRDPRDGRFTVRLPFKNPTPQLGTSRQLALRRFLSMEKKFTDLGHIRDPERKRRLASQWSEYKKFMLEYQELQHMVPVPSQQLETTDPVYYIPHHSVLKESSTTTKLRVVFDASASSSTGISLNDCLLAGPQLQNPMTHIMMRFRLHKIAFTADIAKMYRQIQMHKDDWNYQRIFWRTEPSHPLREYWLCTVTYGTTSAPYLAVKSLQQLAKDEVHRYPIASQIASTDFYVDDLASGTDSIVNAKVAVKNLIEFAGAGSFELRKWTTNSPELLSTIPEALRETANVVELQQDNNVKTLGIYWNTSSDTYHFKFNNIPVEAGPVTKRSILSCIAKIFDPLGLLSPVIISCKIFMQQLWKLQIGWDDKVPDSTLQQWQELKTSLLNIEKISIPRCVNPAGSKKLYLIGCCDASIKAMSAAVYIAYHVQEQPHCRLLTSKTKVAPIKHVTLPRLELISAVLLSEVMKSVLCAIQINPDQLHCFTDSMISYHWITSNPSRWKPYIKRRVQMIHDNIPAATWFHIPGIKNPADCASRGITSDELINHPTWWTGTDFFFSPSQNEDLLHDELQQLNAELNTVTTHNVNLQPSLPLLSKFSSINKLVRVTAYVLRFIKNWNNKKFGRSLEIGTLTSRELQVSQTLILRHVQFYSFPIEITALSSGKNLPSNSKLLSLRPFLGSNGLLRVGGRLENANIGYDQKHQILLPKSHHVTRMIITDHHLRNLHAGPSSTLSSIQQEFWIVNARDTVRYCLKRCVICTRHRATTLKQVMADLPLHRVSPSRPFTKVGIDYAGPFIIKPMVRSKISLKCWLSVFVCFTTRAIHIEAVSSLSTDCFLAALKRFTSRRGVPSDIFSDCGTNFKGADKVLLELFNISISPEVQGAVAAMRIKWHFNPPGAPHFGGLWEAGVKSIKYHLHRVMGAARLTYEEFITLTTQIEGILNSRPLIPASTDPSDLNALTPAHFLVGSELTALPDRDLTEIKENHLQRWANVQRQQQLFWRRWSNEFLTRLQQRPKWLKEESSLEVGDLVLIKEERSPPLTWKLGRIVSVHPGADGHVRVATVKTADGEVKRPVVKLSLLPIKSCS